MTNPQDVVKQLAEAALRRQAEERIEQYVRIFTRMYDRAHAYTTGVVAVGYASAFAIWGFVRDPMSPWRHAAGLLLVVSVTVFVLWEVWSNISASLELRRFANRIAPTKDPRAAVQAMEDYEAQQRKSTVLFTPSWFVSVVVSVLAGVGALGIMAWSLAESLWRALSPA